MKRKLILLCLVFVFAGCATTRDLPGLDGANTVLILTEDHPDAAYRKMGQLLTSRGFTIQNSDRDLGMISTGAKRIGIWTEWDLKLTAVISDEEPATISLNGLTRPMIEERWTQLYYRNSFFRSIQQTAWQELYDIAIQYDGKQIAFERR